MIHLEPNQVFIPGSFAGFKRWLTFLLRKPAMTKPLAPAHLPKSRSKVDADALLAIIKEAKQITSAQLAELLQIDPLSAGNRLKTLRQMGLIAQVGTIKRRPAYAIVDNVRPVTRIYMMQRTGMKHCKCRKPLLTPAQQRVADLFAQGRRNCEIAELLGIDHRTVSCHLSAIYERRLQEAHDSNF